MTGSTSKRPTQSGTTTYSSTPAGQASSTQWHAHTERAPRDLPSGATHQRVEPSLDEPGFPPASDTAYEKLHGLGPDFGEYRPHARSRIRRITMMLGVFVVGAGVGLIAAWWLHRPPPGSLAGVTSAGPSRAATAVAGMGGKRSAPVRGISPSELPYDGAPPPPVSETANADAVRPFPSGSVNMTSGASNGDHRDGISEGTAAAASRDVPVDVPATPVVNRRDALESKSVEAEETTKAARSGKQPGASVASAVPKRRSASKSAGDREIERIRRQADEELKKKTEHRRAPGDFRNGAALMKTRGGTSKVAANSSMSRESSTRAMLVRCDRSTNFIRRELCRWQVCNGSWGRHGCPSYKPHTPNY